MQAQATTQADQGNANQGRGAIAGGKDIHAQPLAQPEAGQRASDKSDRVGDAVREGGGLGAVMGGPSGISGCAGS